MTKPLPDFTLGSDCPPDFDIRLDSAARNQWATNVAQRRDSGLLGDTKEVDSIVAALATDEFGPFQEMIEQRRVVWVAVKDARTMHQPEPHEIVVIELAKDAREPSEVVEAYGPEYWCDRGYRDTMQDLVRSAVDGCSYFYWATEEDLAGYSVTLVHLATSEADTKNVTSDLSAISTPRMIQNA